MGEQTTTAPTRHRQAHRYPPPPWFRARNGVWLHTRAINASDATRLLDLFEKLSDESRRSRFHGDPGRLSDEAKRRGAAVFAGVDNRTMGGALVAVARKGDDEEIVGVVQLGRNSSPTDPEAEVAIVVRDDFQGQGVGRALLERIGALAAQMGVQTLLAVIDVENTAALRLFRSLGLPCKARTRQGQTVLHLSMTE